MYTKKRINDVQSDDEKLSVNMLRNEASSSINADLMAWTEEMANYSSLHGVHWFLRTDNRVNKTIILLFSLIIIILLPTYLIHEAVIFAQDTSVSTSVEWKKATTMVYPNITICFPKYFDNRKLVKYNISNSLANYMTFALNPSLNDFVDFMLSGLTGTSREFETMLEKEAANLDSVLNDRNLTIIELFKAVAMSCEDVIVYCDDHRSVTVSTSLPNGQKNTTCCTLYFNEDPIFTHSGTCYTTNKPIIERFPASFSSVKFLLDTRQLESPGTVFSINKTVLFNY